MGRGQVLIIGPKIRGPRRLSNDPACESLCAYERIVPIHQTDRISLGVGRIQSVTDSRVPSVVRARAIKTRLTSVPYPGDGGVG